MIPEQQSAIDWTNLPPTAECRGRPIAAEDRVSECILEGCEKVPFRRGMCAMHYTRWLRKGDPNVAGRQARDVADRLWERVIVVESGCWEWTGGKDRGYGHIQAISKGPTLSTHRLSYEIWSGAPIPDGLSIDHLCRNRACCNPAHLEAVPIGVNVLRGFANSAINKRKTHCSVVTNSRRRTRRSTRASMGRSANAALACRSTKPTTRIERRSSDVQQ